MEEPESPKTWFIMHEGERFGPFPMEDLKYGVESKELNPRLDLAWKEGMDDWIPVGEVEGLFEKKSKSNDAGKSESKSAGKSESKSSSAFTEYEHEHESDGNDDDEEWPGVNRGGYFFFLYIFPVIWLVGLFYGSKMLTGVLDADLLPIVLGCLALLPFLTGIFAVLQRFQNLAMSRLWFFGLFVPILNIWLGYRLFACPPGYAEKKKLGGLGWILAIIYSLPLIAMAGLGALVATKGPEMFKDVIEKNRAQYEELISKAKELSETPKEAEEKKAKEKGPSIIPITR